MKTQPQVGFTIPTSIYDRMRRTNVSATIMDGDVRSYVTREAFKTAWNTWYAQWREFYDKTMDSKFGNLLRTDDLDERSKLYEGDMARWQEGYAAEKDAGGQPLPSHSPKIPVPTPGQEENESSGIPLWAFLVGLGVIGVGVGAYYVMKKQYQMTKEALPLITSIVAPEAALLSKASHDMPAAFAKVAVGHDVSPSSCGCARDLDIRPAPRAAAKFILSGS